MNSSTVECPHAATLLPSLSLPKGNSRVYREECTQCFDSQDSPLGVDVCLSCFNGGCADPEFHHARLHALKHGHYLALNISRIQKPKVQRSASAEPPMKKLAIREEVEADQYVISKSIKCYGPGCEGRVITVSPFIREKLEAIADVVLASNSSARANEIEAWEEQIETCAHVTQLEQQSNPPLSIQAGATCHACNMDSNLWFCLQCGSLGCGRAQFGGTGGKGHALQHYRDTGHCVNVKLGTITAEGSADLYCYSCDDARTDSQLQRHLAHFGIEIATQEKTEKSMTELQVEQNLKFDFSMIGEDGKHLFPLHGPGLTGLKNLGNSCYLASVLQVLFALPPFRMRYYRNFPFHPPVCDALSPAACLDCQMNKIAHGLISGRYAVPNHDATTHQTGASTEGELETRDPVFQKGISPMMLKALVGKGHPEFSTMRQQDAEEFLGHIFETIQQHAKERRKIAPPDQSMSGALSHKDPLLLDPTSFFRFELEQKLQCVSCRGVRYRLEEQSTLSIPIPAMPVVPHPQEVDSCKQHVPKTTSTAYMPVTLAQCLTNLTTSNTAEYTCPKCQVKTTALTSTRFASFPDYLLVHARRFEVVNWVPKKLEVPLIIEGQQIDLEPYLGCGQQPGEEVLPESDSGAVSEPAVNGEMLTALESMGFPTTKCVKAIHATGNSGVENAANWLFEHLEDAEDSNDRPVTLTDTHSSEDLLSLQDMGFTSNQAEKALQETGGDLNRAVEWLFSHPDDGSSLGVPTFEPTEELLAGPKYGDCQLPAQYKLKAFISHKGPSVHSGHYVAHLQHCISTSSSDNESKESHWVFFNDEKVTKVGDGPLSVEALSPLLVQLLKASLINRVWSTKILQLKHGKAIERWHNYSLGFGDIICTNADP